MGVFNYIAYDESGFERKGVLEGDTAKKVREHLRAQKLMPITVSQVVETSNTPNPVSLSIRRKRINISDLSLLTRELSALLASGMPVAEGLAAVAEQSEKARTKEVILSVRNHVMAGYSLAAGLAEFPQVFPEVYRATVAAGEQSGHLSTVLNHLADHTEKQQRMRLKIRQALIYPSLMTIISILIVIFLLMSVVPKMVHVFQDSGQQLPFLTEVLLSVSDGLQTYGIVIAAGIFFILLLFRYALKRTLFRSAWHQFLLRLPIIGRMNKVVNTARFSRTLGILSSAGVPVLEAIQIASKLITSLPIREAVKKAAVKVGEGRSIHQALKQTGFFQPMTIHFIANGESSGCLEEMLIRAADNQEHHVAVVVDTSLTVFEPLLILFMGAVVLFIVLAVLLPLFGMTELI